MDLPAPFPGFGEPLWYSNIRETREDLGDTSGGHRDICECGPMRSKCNSGASRMRASPSTKRDGGTVWDGRALMRYRGTPKHDRHRQSVVVCSEHDLGLK